METMRKLQNYLIAKFTNRNRVRSLTVDFADYFLCDRIFYFLGVSFLKPNVQKWRRFHLMVSQFFGLLFMTFCAINFFFLHEDSNFFEWFESIRIGAGAGVILFKFIPLQFWYRKEILKVLKQLDEFFPRSYVDQDDQKAEEYLATVKKFFKIAFFLDLTLILAFNCTPVFEQIYAFATDTSVPLRPVVNMYYPFDDLKHGNYEILLCFYLWISTVFVIILLAADNLFVSISQMICMGLNGLAESLAEIDMRDEAEAIERMKEIILTHEKYLEMIESVEKIFSFSFFINMFGIIGVLCLSAFLLISGGDLFNLIQHSLTVPLLIVQTFVQCYFAQKIDDTTSQLAVGAYNSNWYEASVKCRKYILLIMIQSQKGKKIYGLNFIKIDLKTFTWVLNTAYSYFSVLNALYKP